MIQAELTKQTCVDYGVAARPLAGELFSGDAHLVGVHGDDVMLAVIDGIGHGEQAANAATVTIAVLEEHLGAPLEELIERCHRALISERGVAMSLILIQPEKHLVKWLGVGNVWGGLVTGAKGTDQRWKTMPLQRGIVGYQIARLQQNQAAIAPGDWLVLATDGVRADFDGPIAMQGPPEAIARRILSGHSKGNDDALVLVARYRGKRYE